MRYGLTLGAMALALSMSVQAASPFQASDIRIDGLQRVSPGSVFDALAVEPGDTVSDADISAATRALFETGFFDQVEIFSEGSVLVVRVEERPSVSRIEIEGNKAIPTEDLIDSLRRAGVAEGDVLRRATLDQLERAISRQYTGRGRYDARVDTEIVEQERNRVGLKITIFEGSEVTIEGITLVGNTAFDQDELRDEMSLTDGGFFTWYSGSDRYDAERLAADVEALRSFYLNRGYVNAEILEPQVELSEDLTGVFITITIAEGDQFRIGAVNLGGEQPVDLNPVVSKLALQSGEVFNRLLVNQAVAAMSSRLADAGYARAQVRAVPEINLDQKSVDVTLVVTPGPLVYVRRVEFVGNTGTSDVVLRREIPQLESTVSSASAIERGRINLQRTGFFSVVRASTRPVLDQPDQIDVVYEVVEQASGSFSASLGFSQGQGVLFGAAVNQKNFLGSGNAVEFSIQSSDATKEARFSFTDPFFTIDGVSRGIDLYYRETEFDELSTSDYNTDEAGIRLSFGYPVSDRARITTSLGVQNTTLLLRQRDEDVDFPLSITEFLVAEGFEEDTTEAEFLEVLGSVGYTYNTLNKAFFPTDGARHRVVLDLSIPGSDLEYYIASYSGESYLPLSKANDVSLQLKTRLGYGAGVGDSNTLPFLKNFFAGGIRSVRGYEYNSLGPVDEITDDQIGGNVLVTGTAALQFPLIGIAETDQARLSLFTDVGQVYNDSVEVDQLRYSAGLALGWVTPIGPLSFTYGVALNEEDGDQTEGFQFSIGSAF